MNILLLEDDKLFNETLEDFLSDEGFFVDSTLDPYSALDLCYEKKYDLYLFDINLPYESGIELLRDLREAKDMTPTIFITSNNTKEKLKEAFSFGGDDYLIKPIDLDELLLRVKAVLRRQVREEVIKIEDYSFHLYSKELFYKNKIVELNYKSSILLLTLLEAKGKTVLFEEIKDRVWSSYEDASDGSLRVYIAQLKKYFPKNIENVRGVGYKFIR